MPKINKLFAKLKGAKIFSTIDLSQGYHHIALTDDSIPKTAFSTPWGKWEFGKCPFGLNQAPAHFMAQINRVLEGCETFAIVYMDDILIFSVDEETHLKHINLMGMFNYYKKFIPNFSEISKEIIELTRKESTSRGLLKDS